MIRFENVGLASPEHMEFIIEGMRNPMNSWEKSDSYAGHEYMGTGNEYFKLGENDHSLMQRLSNAGTEHRKYMRMMPVYVRITAPLYWWKEFDTYSVGVAPNPTDIIMNSCSTMHKIAEKEFALEDFSCEHICIRQSIDVLKDTIDALNVFRDVYLNGGNLRYENGNIKCFGKKDKEIWWQMIQLLPSSYNQTRNVMLNYEVLANIYRQRKNHKLDEWREFCKWIEGLPYSELITGKGCIYTLNDCVRCVEYKKKPYNAEPPICHLCTVYDKQHGIECQFDEDKSLTDEMIQERIKNRNGSPVYNEIELYWKRNTDHDALLKKAIFGSPMGQGGKYDI